VFGRKTLALFAAFEGLDGSGKSTQIKLLAASLESRGIPVLTTREPGGTKAGEAIREIMFGPKAAPLEPLTWTFLMSAARAQLVSEVIAPAIPGSAVIMADRYWYSTLAYQGAGDGVDQDLIRAMSRTVTLGIEPDLVIYLDVPPETAMARKQAGPRDVLDRRPLEFHTRVAECYRRLAREDPGRWRVFDGCLPSQPLAEQGEDAVMSALSSQAVEVSR
jgi:dTMP kinase